MLPPRMIWSGVSAGVCAALCGVLCVLGAMLTPARRLSPAVQVVLVCAQTVGSFWMLAVDRYPARWMSPVIRFIASVSAICADEMRASCWKKRVASLDSMNAAIETSTPALSATSTSMRVKPRCGARDLVLGS